MARALYRVHVRMPGTESEPRDFNASVTDDNGWRVHLNAKRADATAQYLGALAELYVDDVTDYLPDRGRLWAEAILIAFPRSEIVAAPAPVSDNDDGDLRVY